MTLSKSSPLTGMLFALVGFGAFATHDAIIKSLGGTVSVIQVMFFSSLFAFPWVSLMVLSDGAKANFRPHHPWLLIMRTISGLCTAGFGFFAFMQLPMAEVYGLLFTTPLIITLLSVPFLGERLGVARITAVLIGLGGVLIMLPWDDRVGLSLGHISALLAALSASINAVLTRKIGADEREVVMIMMPMALSIVILAIILPTQYSPVGLGSLYSLMAIGALGFLGQLGIIMGYKRSDAAVIAPMQYSQLIWAIIYGSLFFSETVNGRQILGATIIVASGLIILYRERKGTNSINRPTSTMRNFRPGVSRSLLRAADRKG